MFQRYIEIVSDHRDRLRFPHPSEFVVQLGLSSTCNPFNATNAVYDGTVYFPPPNLAFPSTHLTTSYMYGSTINNNQTSPYFVSLLPLSSTTHYLTTPIYPSSSQQVYTGMFLELVQHDVASSTVARHEYRRIVDYTIGDPEQIVATIDDGNGPITVDSISLDTECDIDQFFVGWTVRFTTTTDSTLSGIERTIVAYRAHDRRIYFDQPIMEHILTDGDTLVLEIASYRIRLDTPFSVGSLPPLDERCEQSDFTTYRIRSGIPLETGTVVAGTPTSITLPPSVGSRDYTGSMVWLTSNPLILSGVLVSGGFNDDGTIQTSGTFTLSGTSFENDFLNGMEMTLTSGNFEGFTYVINAWDAATQTGVVIPGWTSLIIGTTHPTTGDTFEIRQVKADQYRLFTTYDTDTRIGHVSQAFTYTTMRGQTIQYTPQSDEPLNLLHFSTDQYNQLEFPESVVNQQQSVCYELSLQSLTLPTGIMKNGGTILDYPYVYVKFSGQTQGTSFRDFYSNNPVATSMTFRALLRQNCDIGLLAFIILEGDMTPTIKFQPHDTFLFAVYLPDGTLFETQEAEYNPPSLPNSHIQISACFGMRRLSQ